MQGKSKPRRTRGPRTPNEKATDAMRTAATLFEKLPPSHTGDELLKPIAKLFRTINRGLPDGDYVTLRDLQDADEAETGLLELMADWRWLVREMPLKEALHIEAMAETLRRELREVKEQIAAAYGDTFDV